LIPLGEGNPFVHMGRSTNPTTMDIPTETVVCAPTFVAPKQARVYRTGLYMLDGRPATYPEISSQPGFSGTGSCDEVLLVEVWMDYGDDGHVCYSLFGHRFVPASRLRHEMDNPEEFMTGYHRHGSGLPLCMSWPDGDFGYEQTFAERERRLTAVT